MIDRSRGAIRDEAGRGAGLQFGYRYSVYGVDVASDAPLALPAYSTGSLGEVECLTAPAGLFAAAAAKLDPQPASCSWYRQASLPDGSTYVRWEGVGEFLVAPGGRRISYRQLKGASVESFQAYMLGQALSFALIEQRFEPLHATAVVIDREAIAFLGSNAYGKSSLAACFLEAGDRVLTDDLLMLQPSPGGVLAYPGPPRIKLFRGVAKRFLSDAGDHGAMNAETDKLIVPLDDRRRCSTPVMLRAIYTLAPPRDVCRRPEVSIATLSPREAFVELIKGTFNRRLVNRQRLERQFRFAAGLSELVPVRKLRYPRTIDRLPDVRAMLVADLARPANAAVPATAL